jgi:hypothetical protein
MGEKPLITGDVKLKGEGERRNIFQRARQEKTSREKWMRMMADSGLDGCG